MSPSSPASALPSPTGAPVRGSAPATPVVHLWWAWVGDATSDDQRAADLALLDERERARAARFRADRDRGRYVARHAFYRRVLAQVLGTTPAAVRIGTARTGRPELVSPDAPDFNASHADGLAVIAVAHGRRVGVDVERHRELEDEAGLAATQLTARELADLGALPEGRRGRALLAAWTRKEAVTKAVGVGLSLPFEGVDTGPMDGPATRQVGGLPGGRSFVVTQVEGIPGRLCAIALEATGIEVRPHAPSRAAA